MYNNFKKVNLEQFASREKRGLQLLGRASSPFVPREVGAVRFRLLIHELRLFDLILPTCTFKWTGICFKYLEKYRVLLMTPPWCSQYCMAASWVVKSMVMFEMESALQTKRRSCRTSVHKQNIYFTDFCNSVTYLDCHPMVGFSHRSCVSNSTRHLSVWKVPDCMADLAGMKMRARRLRVYSAGVSASVLNSCCKKLTMRSVTVRSHKMTGSDERCSPHRARPAWESWFPWFEERSSRAEFHLKLDSNRSR